MKEKKRRAVQKMYKHCNILYRYKVEKKFLNQLIIIKLMIVTRPRH